MKDTGDLAADPRAVVPGMARHYMKRGSGYQTSGPWNMATGLAAGSMYSTVRDMLLFDQGLYRNSFNSIACRRNWLPFSYSSLRSPPFPFSWLSVNAGGRSWGPDSPFRVAVIASFQGDVVRSMTLARFLRLFSC